MDMKHIKVLFLSVVCLVAATLTASAAKYPNHPLPNRPDTLKILAIGNSFSDDGTQHLPALLEGAGIHNVIVARLYIGGCTLERHCQEYEAFKEKGLRSYIYYKSTDNEWVTVSKNATILDGLKDEFLILSNLSALSVRIVPTRMPPLSGTRPGPMPPPRDTSISNGTTKTS